MGLGNQFLVFLLSDCLRQVLLYVYLQLVKLRSSGFKKLVKSTRSLYSAIYRKIMMMRTRRKTKKTLEIMCSRKFFPHTPQTQVITPESYSHIPGIKVFSETYLSCGVNVGNLSLVSLATFIFSTNLVYLAAHYSKSHSYCLASGW